MGHKRNYTWEFKLQMVQLLEKGEQNPSQISRIIMSLAACCMCGGSSIRSEGKQLLCRPRPFKVHQKSIDRRMHKNRLPIWNGCVDNRRWNLICYDRRWMC